MQPISLPDAASRDEHLSPDGKTHSLEQRSFSVLNRNGFMKSDDDDVHLAFMIETVPYG